MRQIRMFSYGHADSCFGTALRASAVAFWNVATEAGNAALKRDAWYGPRQWEHKASPGPVTSPCCLEQPFGCYGPRPWEHEASPGLTNPLCAFFSGHHLAGLGRIRMFSHCYAVSCFGIALHASAAAFWNVATEAGNAALKQGAWYGPRLWQHNASPGRITSPCCA